MAGGASRRFGTDNKLLAEISGRPLIRWVTEEVARSGADDLVVVTGCDHLLIEKALGGLLLKFAHNPNWAVGMGFSIAVGVGALSAQVQGALVIPGDMPFLTCDLMKTLVAAFDRSDGASIVFPITALGEQRNPVLWPRPFFPLLSSLEGPSGAKWLLQSFAGRCKPISIGDEGAFADVDTTKGLEIVRSNWRRFNR